MACTTVLFRYGPEKAERTVIEKTLRNFGRRSETCTSAKAFSRPIQRRRGGTVICSPGCDFGRKKEDAGHGCVQVLVLEKEEAAHPSGATP